MQLTIEIGASDVVVHLRRSDGDTSLFGVPFGVEQLRTQQLRTDPPRPEELTNAIGAVVDHLDDLVRIDMAVLGASAVVRGPEAVAIAAVEVGGDPILPFVLDRAAAEDVFRTIATESRRDRAHNPGLATEMVDRIVAGCCILVGVMRRLHLEAVTVEP